MRRTVKNLSLILILCLVLSLLCSCSESLKSKYESAQVLLSQGKFAEAAEKFEALGSYEESRKLTIYCKAVDAGECGDYETAFNGFRTLGEYKDSPMMLSYYNCRMLEDGNWQSKLYAARLYDQNKLFRDSAARAENCRRTVYNEAVTLQQAGKYEEAITVFEALNGYSDSTAQVEACRESIRQRDYQAAVALQQAGKYEEAITAFEALNGYGDSAAQIEACRESIRQRDYQAAVALQQAGKYEEAITAFEALNGYGDSATQITETKYLKAKYLVTKGDYAGAAAILIGIRDYKDVDSLLKNDDNLSAAARDAEYSVGNYVTFGHYPQTSAGTDSTAIEWLVVARDGNKALLLSRYGLDVQPYNTQFTNITWENCTLRTWLNGTFLNKAFTAQEQGGILQTNVDNSKSQCYSGWSTSGGNNTQDKVFLLSYAEANMYLDVTYLSSNNTKSRVAPTAYAVKQGAYTYSSNKTADGTAAGWWWLRSPGNYRSFAAYVNSDGSLFNYYVNYVNCCVRPALWINLESDIF